MSWKKHTLANAYEYHKEDTFNGNGIYSNWKKERPDMTYEDYWIFVCLVGHENYRKYLTAHLNDCDIMGA